ncbi:uncharacterized protein DFL_000311 [Arthrobotrys flagrans]|uniref:Uncharacterized protein n=1 Tax=Arthrobotrys flagrans TaxID=97331 RepID=A0A437ADR6_ARTFL|nr:hypothetical protein DFL_000311 [Arthrobotrys flagrans]
MSAMTMEAELKRIRELYDPRRDSTDIFARQYRAPTHGDYEDTLIVDSSGVHGNISKVTSPYTLKVPVNPTNLPSQRVGNLSMVMLFNIQKKRECCISTLAIDPTVGSSSLATPQP